MWTRLPCHPSHLTNIVSVSQPLLCCYNERFFQRQIIMHCLSAQALISYPDITLFFGRGRSGYEITQAPLVLLWYVCLRVACFRFSDCGDGAGRWERGFKKALPLPLFLIISPLSQFAFHPTIRTPGTGYCERRLSNFVKILTKLISSMFHKSLPQTTLRAVVSPGLRSVASGLLKPLLAG